MAERIIVVTGAGTGIGRAIAAKMLEGGNRVVGIGRRLDVLEEARQTFGERRGHFQALSADVRDATSLARTLERVGPIHAIVANAGIVRQARLSDFDAEATWNEVLAVNLDGVFHTLRAAEPHLTEGGRGVIVSSGLGKLGRAAFGAYAASKHGVLGLMKCVAKELAPRKITVNAVCPGWVETDMARGDLARFAEERGLGLAAVEAEILEAIPLRRFVRPEEVASLVAWLISDDAAAVTGEAFNVSCGEFFA